MTANDGTPLSYAQAHARITRQHLAGTIDTHTALFCLTTLDILRMKGNLA